ncbi:trem-like transcript 4 protein [Vombatus ursinus]|uniref:Ig-like domain-containing protein n=1 Tax=Vombatus ursinus TaxID=29139 RepID=A0A4X2M4P0_VOMUR|nr:trem-like transcript 4 protein [Vombatus ursinus]XP_027732490.1 trem-like transcript 4 protein [Vombatus ursinus]
MERSKMTPEVLLQLLLLLLWVSYERGSLGKEVYEDKHRVVGETLTVSCQYTPQKPDHLDKAWCKKIVNATTCTLLITRPRSRSKTEDRRYSLSYNTNVISINMSDLRVEDSGEYWCGNHNSSANVIDVFKKVHLTVAPAPTQRTTQQELTTMIEAIAIISTTKRSPNCLLLLVVFGLLLLKGLTFLVLLVLLFRFKNQSNGYTGKVEELNKLELSEISPYLSSS